MSNSQTDKTLTEALKEIGVEHVASALPGYRWLYADDAYLGPANYAEGWELVHQAEAAA